MELFSIRIRRTFQLVSTEENRFNPENYQGKSYYLLQIHKINNLLFYENKINCLYCTQIQFPLRKK